MKSLSGANPESKSGYRKQTMHELEKLQAKCVLLNELLNSFDASRGEKFAKGDAYDQVTDVCREAEEGDPESLVPRLTGIADTFLHTNGMIDNVLDRYERYQKGVDTAVVEQISFASDDSATTTAPSNPANDLDGLFGPAPSTTSAPSPSPAQHTDPRASIMAAFNQQPMQASQPQFGQFGGTVPPREAGHILAGRP
ncbi:hypothetical protein FRC07_011725 [Ceratobasidium sp. 392]|nr:hypothetical protein FRC07_011725 [Ceratobasidium sp. 392]